MRIADMPEPRPGSVGPLRAGEALVPTRAAWFLGALALFLLARPHAGIVQDAVLYMGRAVADGDPAGLGQDILFRLDGQSRFSLFTLVSDGLVRRLGPDAASWWLGRLGLLAWFAALAAFAVRIAGGRLLWAILAVVALAPAAYGGDGGFRYAEPYAIPRPFAEAAVLAGLAAILAGRGRLAAFCLTAAALLHPIMAAPGIAVALALACRHDRRWLAVPGAGLVLLVAAAALGLPVAGRLFTAVDPAWSDAIHQTHVPYPSLWPGEAWATIVVQAVTVALAARALDGGPRRMLVAIGAVAACGVAVAAVLGEGLSLVLVLQVQPWRALWLLKVAAAASLPVAALSLWRQGPAGRLALACLCFAWLSAETAGSPATLVGAGAAAVAATLGTRRPDLVTPMVARAAWLGFAAYGLLWCWLRASFAYDLAASAPESAAALRGAWLMEALKPALAAGAIAWLLHPRWRAPALSVWLASLALALAAFAGFDARTGFVRRLDAWRPDPAFVALLPGEGEILWIRGGVMRPWVLAGRPNWISAVQGSSVVFSRDLALAWDARMARLLAAGLGDASDRSPNLAMAERRDLVPAADALAAFCAAPDAPVAIVAPRDGGFRVPDGVPSAAYRAPEPEGRFGLASDGRPLWSDSQDFAVIRCREAGARG